MCSVCWLQASSEFFLGSLPLLRGGGGGRSAWDLVSETVCLLFLQASCVWEMNYSHPHPPSFLAGCSLSFLWGSRSLQHYLLTPRRGCGPQLIPENDEYAGRDSVLDRGDAELVWLAGLGHQAGQDEPWLGWGVEDFIRIWVPWKGPQHRQAHLPSLEARSLS